MSVRFLATCFIHSPFGSEVIPPMHTQRVAISMCDFKFEAAPFVRAHGNVPPVCGSRVSCGAVS